MPMTMLPPPLATIDTARTNSAWHSPATGQCYGCRTPNFLVLRRLVLPCGGSLVEPIGSGCSCTASGTVPVRIEDCVHFHVDLDPDRRLFRGFREATQWVLSMWMTGELKKLTQSPADYGQSLLVANGYTRVGWPAFETTIRRCAL